MTNARNRPQGSFDEEALADPELERAVLAYLNAKEAAEPYVKDAASQKKTIDGMVTKKELPEGLYRIGSSVISISHHAASAVEFDRRDGDTIRVRRAKTKS